MENKEMFLEKYKGFVIAVSKNVEMFYVFTKDEWLRGTGYRYPEFECCSVAECKENIDSSTTC